MNALKIFTDRLQSAPSDCVGIDFGVASTKLARLRRAGSDITLVAAEVLQADVGDLVIPPRLRARCAALATSRGKPVTKLLTFPGVIDAAFEARIPKTLGLREEDDCRVSYRLINEGLGRTEARALAVALPKTEADPIIQRFATGHPAPLSLEISPLATLTAFEYGPVTEAHGQALGLIDFGSTLTTLSFFHRGNLVLMRQFDFGTQNVLDRVKSSLHVDTETAQGILADSAFDISELLRELVSPIINQFVVSRDFVERHENCTDVKLYAIGGIALSQASLRELEHALNTDVAPWDPLASLNIGPEAMDDATHAQSWRLAAAIGAALSALEES